MHAREDACTSGGMDAHLWGMHAHTLGCRGHPGSLDQKHHSLIPEMPLYHPHHHRPPPAPR